MPVAEATPTSARKCPMRERECWEKGDKRARRAMTVTADHF
jgi:hypothetical protein